jgi:hypothetical protein
MTVFYSHVVHRIRGKKRQGRQKEVEGVAKVIAGLDIGPSRLPRIHETVIGQSPKLPQASSSTQAVVVRVQAQTALVPLFGLVKVADLGKRLVGSAKVKRCRRRALPVFQAKGEVVNFLVELDALRLPTAEIPYL